MTNEDKWKAWHEEIQSFLDRDTEGFTQDLKALEYHIRALQLVCPKDKAGWPVSKALIYLNKLKKDYTRFADILIRLKKP